eukprot:CAMPEP_0194526938 /NCGR_PEP_ID=MMETSP0253-20130528/62878_1 /TAXON_ID=2966 /ORGANISM="Noctiluca scintillans" /LENGTH=62 /DNA_ID=CAMNT_0039371805 /DNA_START=48 /DNA_END=233 /DNA_ORIENTATION=+
MKMSLTAPGYAILRPTTCAKAKTCSEALATDSMRAKSPPTRSQLDSGILCGFSKDHIIAHVA